MIINRLIYLTLMFMTLILNACVQHKLEVKHSSITTLIEKNINPFLAKLSQEDINSMKREAWKLYGKHWKGVSNRSRYVRQPMLDTLDRYHFPRDLQMIPVVESSYNPYAQSAVGATGLWQLMPITAKDMGIKHSANFDGRRDIHSSTKAAATYLTKQYKRFGNWPMALAAYHLGPHAVQRRLNRRAWKPENGINKAPLPPITRTYIRHIIGLIALYQDKRLSFPKPYSASIMQMQTPIDLAALQRNSGLPTNQIFKFNPQLALQQYFDHKQQAIPLRISNRRIKSIKRNLPTKYQQFMEIRIQADENMRTIVRRFKTSTHQLRKYNPTMRSNLEAGQTLRIPLKAIKFIAIKKNPLVQPAIKLLASN